MGNVRKSTTLHTIEANLQRTMPEVRFLGSACWVAWILLIYSMEFFGEGNGVHDYSALCYLVSTLSIALAYLYFGIWPEKGFRLTCSKRSHWVRDAWPRWERCS